MTFTTNITPNDFDDFLRCRFLLDSYPSSLKPNHDIYEKKELINLASTLFSYKECISSHIFSSPCVMPLEDTLYTQPKLYSSDLVTNPDLIHVTKQGLSVVIILPSYQPRRSELNHLSMCYSIISFLKLPIVSMQLFCINPYYKKRKHDEQSGALFRRIDVTGTCKSSQKKIKQLRSYIYSKQKQQTPVLDKHCFKPKECRHFKQCWPEADSWDVFNIYNMPFDKKLTLFKDNKRSAANLKALHNLSYLQHKQCVVEESQTSFINHDVLNECLKPLTSSFYCFDIEVTQFVHPLFKGQKPFEATPFLFSTHYSNTTFSSIKHSDTLFLPTSDFRRSFAESLIKHIRPHHSIVVFDATLEQKIIQQLAASFPDLADQLRLRLDYIIDIAPLFINHHIILPGQKGKASLKHIITALNTSKNYTQLSVQSGLDAVAIYKQLLYNPQADTQLISQDLKEYCKQDTQAILDVLKFLISELRNV